MLLSVLVSTAAASEAPTPVLPEPPSPASAWSTPPQLSVSASRLHTHTQMVSILGSMAVVGAAGLSSWAISRDLTDRSFIAGANVVVFAVPGAVLGAMTLMPAMQLASEGVQWAPTLGIASIAAGLTSVSLALASNNGQVPNGTLFLAAGLAWASPLLALSEVLMASRAGWQAQGSEVSFSLLPKQQGAHGTVTWSF